MLNCLSRLIVEHDQLGQALDLELLANRLDSLVLERHGREGHAGVILVPELVSVCDEDYHFKLLAILVALPVELFQERGELLAAWAVPHGVVEHHKLCFLVSVKNSANSRLLPAVVSDKGCISSFEQTLLQSKFHLSPLIWSVCLPASSIVSWSLTNLARAKKCCAATRLCTCSVL